MKYSSKEIGANNVTQRCSSFEALSIEAAKRIVAAERVYRGARVELFDSNGVAVAVYRNGRWER